MKIIFLLVFLGACSSTPSRPSLYPNETYEIKGPEEAKKDIDSCLSRAEEYLKTPDGKNLAKNIDGDVSTTVGLGLGMGGVGFGFGVGQNQPRVSAEETVRRRFSAQCLVNKGYQVVGWD